MLVEVRSWVWRAPEPKRGKRRAGGNRRGKGRQSKASVDGKRGSRCPCLPSPYLLRVFGSPSDEHPLNDISPEAINTIITSSTDNKSKSMTIASDLKELTQVDGWMPRHLGRELPFKNQILDALNWLGACCSSLLLLTISLSTIARTAHALRVISFYYYTREEAWRCTLTLRSSAQGSSSSSGSSPGIASTQHPRL